MNDILNPSHHEVIAQVAWAQTLLAFDFDGTLAPIVDARDDAAMRPKTHALLTRLSDLFPCVIISGRSVEDVSKRVRGIRFKHVIGNHGLEPGRGMADFEAITQCIKPLLVESLHSLQGVDIEDKKYSLAIHYRRSRSKRTAQTAISESLSALPTPVRIILGKQVVNVLPEAAPHKGDAIRQLRSLLGADVAFYVGDDVTDEDVFEMDEPGRLFSVRVGHSKASAAEFYVRTQHDVDALLEQLLRQRQKERSPFV